MAQICIITTTGMKCLSSPHEFKDGAWRALPGDAAKEAKWMEHAQAFRKDHGAAEVVAKVLRLLLDEGFDPTQPFCLMSKGETPATMA